MQRAVFTYHPTDMPTLPHREVRWAMAKGRSVIVKGFTLGESQKDKGFLASLAGATFPGRVRFEGCTFVEHVNLSDTTFEQTLHLRDCTFAEGLKLQDASVGGRCSLRGSVFYDEDRHWLNWRGLSTAGGLSLICVTTEAAIDLYQATIKGDLRMDGVRISRAAQSIGNILLNSSLEDIEQHLIIRDMQGKALNLRGATISGDVLFVPFSPLPTSSTSGRVVLKPPVMPYVGGSIDLCATVAGSIGFSNAEICRGEAGISLWMERASVGGSIAITQGTQLHGYADLRGQFAGQVRFEASVISSGDTGLAVDLGSSVLGDSVFFCGGTIINGSIDLRAHVRGQVAFENAHIRHRHGGTAITLAEATIGGSVAFCDGTSVIGSVNLQARIGGQVRFNHTAIDGGDGHIAIVMDQARIEGAVLFGDRTVLFGVLDLRAYFGAQVSFSDTTIEPGQLGRAITFEGATLVGPLMLGSNTVIGGTLVLLHCTLQGGMHSTANASNTQFYRPGGTPESLWTARHCVILGDLVMNGVSAGSSVRLHGLSVDGQILGVHLRVEGDVHICGGVSGRRDNHHFVLARQWLGAKTRQELLSRAIDFSGPLGPAAFGVYKTEHVDIGQQVDEAVTNLASTAKALGWQRWELDSAPLNARIPAIDIELSHIQGHLWIKGQRVLGTVNVKLARVKGDANFDRSLIDGDLVLRDATVEGAFEAKPSPPHLPFEADEPAPLVAGEIDARGAKFESVKLLLGEKRTPRDLLARAYRFDGATVGSFEARGWIDYDETKRFSMHRLRFKDLVLNRIEAKAFPLRTRRDRLRSGFATALALSVILALAWGEWAWSSVVVLCFLAAYVAVALWLRHDDKARRRSRPVLDFLDATIFSSAFHVDVERWARARGDDPHADEIFLKRRRRELSDGEGAATVNENSPTGRDFSRLHLWYRRGVLDFVFGYRVRWQRALHVFVLFWLLNWAVFLPHTAMESTTNAREPDSREQATPPASHEWGPQRAFFMATRLQVPFVELFIDAEWKPADRVLSDHDLDGGFPWLTYENYAAIMRIINLILVPVIIAGATGLLKPREAQYTGAS